MSSKDTEQYATVFRAVDKAAKDYLIENCVPRRIMVDFEKAILNACEEMYDVEISCCFFHLGQSVYRNVQSSGLQEEYNDPNDRTIKVNVHMLLALAFVPSEDVKVGLEVVKKNAPKQLESLIEYFSVTYVAGKPAKGRRKAVDPRYPVETWNQYTAALSGSHKTNNISEGWHNRFRLVVGKHHPDLYSALGEFQKEQADVDIAVAEVGLGRKVKAAPKPKWIELQLRIQELCKGYVVYKEEGKIEEYLRNLSCTIVL